MSGKQIVLDHLAANSKVSGITVVKDVHGSVVRSIHWTASSDASGVVKIDSPQIGSEQTISERIVDSRPLHSGSPMDLLTSMTHYERTVLIVFAIFAFLLLAEMVVVYQYLKRCKTDQFEDMSFVRQGVTGVG